MQHIEAFKLVRGLFHYKRQTDLDVLSGPTLLEQEPDLARENARYSMVSSAWAAGGHPLD